MALPSTLLLIFSSAKLVSGQLHPVIETSTEPRTVDLGEKRHQDRDQRSVGSLTDKPECQEGDPLGTTYIGSVNVTIGGRTCQNWAATEPHEPTWTDVGKVGETQAGDHNYCRNPSQYPGGVWCYTTDPDVRAEYCSLPICPKVFKVLDFSADSDHEPDSNFEYTSATLEAGPLPESFTICSAFMVEAWTTGFSAAFMFTLLNDNGYKWIFFKLYAARSYTEYEVRVGQATHLNQTEDVFFPLHTDTEMPSKLNLRLGF